MGLKQQRERDAIISVRAQVGSLRAEWLAEERTQVVGTFPPRKRGWTGLVEKDTAGQTNIYSVEVTLRYKSNSAATSLTVV